jgi:hypothetical protein
MYVFTPPPLLMAWPLVEELFFSCFPKEVKNLLICSMYVYALLRGGGRHKKTLLLSRYGSDPHPSAPIEDKKLKLHFFSPFFYKYTYRTGRL